MKDKTRFVVELLMPANVSVAEMKTYIEGEVKAGIGMLPPIDPLHYLDRNSVEVKSFAAVMAAELRKKP